jgi:hypothetical protein
VKYGVVVGEFFTGASGGWGHGLATARGTDVSGRKHDWEGWHGDFIKAHNGEFYAQAGKGFHGIARIEGLNDFRVHTQPLHVEAEASRQNRALRPLIVARHRAVKAARGGKTKTHTALDRAKRLPRFRLDGEIEDWGSRENMAPIGAGKSRLRFAAARDDRGLYLALDGEGPLDNRAGDWRHVLFGGFGIDVLWRARQQTAPDLREGDRRIVFARHGGRWMGVLYDYVCPGAAPGAALSFSSPVLDTRIDRVARLAEGEYGFVLRETLGIDLVTLGALGGVDAEPALGPDREDRAPGSRGGPTWTAEIFLPWRTLGVEDGSSVRFDIGVLQPSKEKDAAAVGVYWAHAAPPSLGNPAVQALLNPGAWGTLSLR